MQRVLVTGATGHLGTETVRILTRRGEHVRALTRRPEPVAAAHETVRGDLTKPETLGTAVKGIDVVVACAGQSLRMDRLGDRRSFRAVDLRGNTALLEAVLRAGVKRFVYVSLAEGAALRATAYADAHERFAERLRRSGIDHTVVRPTALFWFFRPLVDLASRGMAAVLGDGTARTNPIHELEVAGVLSDLVHGGPAEVVLGGPDVLTRRELVELALRAADRRGRVRGVWPAPVRAAATLLHPFHPRLAELTAFGVAVSLRDCIAPRVGRRRLQDYLMEGEPVAAS